jgi:hypothetical protein
MMRLRTLLTILVVPLAGTAAAGLLARAVGIGPEDRLPLAAALATLALLLVPPAVLALDRIVTPLRETVRGRPGIAFVIAAAFVSPYLLYWAVPGNARLVGILGLVAYAAAPALVAAAWPVRGRPGGAEALIVLALWLPVDFRWLKGAFPWPPGGSGYILVTPLALGLLIFLVVVVRRIEGVGYLWRLTGPDAALAAGAFVAFVLAGIPIGLTTGFLEIARAWPTALEAAVKGTQIFLFTALPEEALFRGCVQNFLERWTGRPWTALALASVIFGAAHLNNGPAPDWRYFVLATLAGVAYGWVFRRTRGLAAPALTHMLVDLTWSLFFKG